MRVAVTTAAAIAIGVLFGRDLTTAAPQASRVPLHYGEVPLAITTPLGVIEIAIDQEHAPVTAGNFRRCVDAGLYANGRFYRVTRPDNYTAAPPDRPMMNLIQGGIDPAKAAQRLPAIPLERTSVTHLSHVTGTISMARGTAADTATSEFFILLDDQPSLDFGGHRFDDSQGAAAFGRVVAGLDVVRAIQQQRVADTGNRQNLATPVPIVSIAATPVKAPAGR